MHQVYIKFVVVIQGMNQKIESQKNQHSKSDMHFIIIQLAAQQIGGHNDGGFVRYSKSDGVQKGQERRS